MKIENLSPQEIERRSFEIIKNELNREFLPDIEPIILRVIHTTADFEYADLLKFSDTAIEAAKDAVNRRELIVTDTNMAKAGMTHAAKPGINIICYMADEDVATIAKQRGITRAVASMEKAVPLPGKPVFVIGNAPTALIRLCELVKEGNVSPSLIVGAPVGFVNVIHSKEMLMTLDIPYICVAGRKGGSTVAAAIVNAFIKRR